MSTEPDITLDDPPADAPTSTPIHSLMAQASMMVGAVGKDADNVQQGFRYRSMAAVTAAVQPVLSSLGIAIVPKVLLRDVALLPVGNQGKSWRLVSLMMRYRFVGPAGDYVDVVTVGEGFDPSDKAANKAMTNAMKYALVQAFCIAEAEVDEADAAGPHDGINTTADTPPAQPQRRGQRRQARSSGSSGRTAPRAAKLAKLALDESPEHAAAVEAIMLLLDGIDDPEHRKTTKDDFATTYGLPLDLAPESVPEAREWVEARLTPAGAPAGSEGAEAGDG